MKQTQERITCHAVITKQSELPYEDIASTKGIPVIKPIYEVVFLCEGGEVLFSLSEFEYSVLQVGQSGTLVYEKKKHCNELISFTDDTGIERIKEFKGISITAD